MKIVVLFGFLYCSFGFADDDPPQFPVPAEHHELSGVETFISWPSSGAAPSAVMLLFHGCSNRGADWFRKPEEIRFLQAAQNRGLALVAFTAPRHRGNFCWPSPGQYSKQDDLNEGKPDDFEVSVALVKEALLEVLSERLPSADNSSDPVPLILVGGSSGGNFASQLPELWTLEFLQNRGEVSKLLLVVSPSAFIRRGEILRDAPLRSFPSTGFVYMPRDQTFASEAAVTAMSQALRGNGKEVKAWSVGPRALGPVEHFTSQLRLAGVAVEDGAATKFLEALHDLGALADSGEVLEDPRRIPWHRASWMLAEGLPRSRPDRNADPAREHRLRCVEELLNRAWAQHEFAAADIADEVLDWLLSGIGSEVRSEL